MNKWVKDNPAVVIVFFTLLLGIHGVILFKSDRVFAEVLTAKDVTIEQLHLKIENMENEKARHYEYKQVMDAQLGLMNEIANKLHAGRATFTADQLNTIAGLLDVDPAWLLTGRKELAPSGLITGDGEMERTETNAKRSD